MAFTSNPKIDSSHITNDLLQYIKVYTQMFTVLTLQSQNARTKEDGKCLYLNAHVDVKGG